MRILNKCDGERSIADGGNRDVENDAQYESSLTVRREGDVRIDCNVARLDVLTARDVHECTLETRRVANGEQLLGVRATSGTTHLGRKTQVDVELIVGRVPVTFTTSDDVGLGGVENFCHDRSSLETKGQSTLLQTIDP